LRSRRKAFTDAQPQPFTLVGRAYNPALKDRRPDLAFLYDSIMALNPPRDLAALQVQRPEREIATTEKLAKLAVPVLFVCGEKDAIVPPEIIKHAVSLVPGARYVEVPGSGHSVYFEEPDAFNRAVSEFFASVAAPVAARSS
jgi:pimeloyl-ACP methyl ester carboxylesterase